jgi:hypothetical protein
MLRSSFREPAGTGFETLHLTTIIGMFLDPQFAPFLPQHERHIDAASMFLEHLTYRCSFCADTCRRMELLLNLLWLLLALPAFWLWRYSRTAPEKKSSPFHIFLALSCLLVVLFPVISATDDMCAMRAEMEESSSSRRSVGQSSDDKSSLSKSLLQPALTVTLQPSFVLDSAWHQPIPVLTSTAVSPSVTRAARAPPSLLLR